MTVTFVLPMAIVFVAGILTGVTGFGFSVLSVPLLLLVFQPHEVVVIALCLVPLTSAVLLLAPGLRGQVRVRMVGALTAFSVIGLPVGIVLFEHFDPMWVTGLMGLVLLGYAAYGLTGPAQWRCAGTGSRPAGSSAGSSRRARGSAARRWRCTCMGGGCRRGNKQPPWRPTSGPSASWVSDCSRCAVPSQGDDLQLVVRLGGGAVLGTLVGRWWASSRHETLDRVILVALGSMGVWTVGRSVVWLTRGSLGMTDMKVDDAERRALRGVVPIPVTTFDRDGTLDLDGLRSQVEFCLGHGADGVLYPGVVSEFYTLTDEERRSAVETVVDAVGGRAPVAVGVTGASTECAVEFTRHAADARRRRGDDDGAVRAALLQSPRHEFVGEHTRGWPRWGCR